MEIRYTRVLNRNYIHFLPDRIPDTDSYEMHMVLSGQADCLLPCSLTTIDGNTFLSFDISSRKPLSSLSDRGAFREETVRGILTALLDALRSLTECLLDLTRVPLHPDYMFFAEEPLRIRLCYFPPDTQNPWTDLGRIAEFLLMHLDPSDAAALMLTYSLFREAGDGTASPEALLMKAAGVPAFPRSAAQADHASRTETEDFPEDPDPFPSFRDPGVYHPYEEEDDGLSRSGTAGDAAGLSFVSSRKVRQTAIRVLFALSVPVTLSLTVLSLTASYSTTAVRITAAVFGILSAVLGVLAVRTRRSGRKKAGPDDLSDPARIPPDLPVPAPLPGEESFFLSNDIFSAPVPPDVPLPDRKGTTLLGSSPSAKAFLAPAPGFWQPAVPLPDQTVILGAQPGKNGIVIRDDTVSRMHVKIHISDKGYFLEDLSSTNGTFVNGQALLGKEKKKLRNGDLVRIAALEYVFNRK